MSTKCITLKNKENLPSYRELYLVDKSVAELGQEWLPVIEPNPSDKQTDMSSQPNLINSGYKL